MSVSSVPAKSYSTSDWQKGYTSLRQESSYWLDPVHGSLPMGLVGTLFRNGPGQLDVGGQAYGHPFDGDGMIVAMTFRDGRLHCANRFIQTPEYLAEQKAGQILYRGVFGTQKPGGWWRNFLDLRFKNPANTNVIYQGGKLLALWEASSPYRLDPATLETLGRETFNGAIQPDQPFTAHPRRDPKTGDLWAFGVRTGLNSTLSLYRVDERGSLVEKQEHRIPGFCFLHDYIWTPNYRIFFQNPVQFHSLPFVLGLKPAGMCLTSVLNTPTKILVFDRQGSLITLESSPGFIFHFVNGFETGDYIVVDAMYYQDYPNLDPAIDYREIDFATVPPASLRRYTLSVSDGSVREETLVHRSVEFPVIHPHRQGQAYRYAYMGATHERSGNAPLQAILKVDLETGSEVLQSFAPRCFVSEPIFVPDSQSQPGDPEDRGWLIVTLFDAGREASSVVILDANDLGIRCQFDLPHHLPYGLHGSFTQDIFV